MTKSKEILTCEMCSSSWSRMRSRGRKPRFCPSCVQENVVPFSEVAVVSNLKTKNIRSATKWVCPSCGEGVTIFINLEYPPICRNKASHSSKGIEMQKIQENRQKEAVS